MAKWFFKKVPTERSCSPSESPTRSVDPTWGMRGYGVYHTKDLLRTGKYSDLTISCQGRVFHVHQVIVCPQVKFLETAVRSGFKEATESHIDLPADDPRFIEMALLWCYCREYGPENEQDIFQVYMVAEKFGIPDLKMNAQNKLVDWADFALPFPGVAGFIDQVWREAPPHEKELRQKMVQGVAKHYESFRSEEDWKKVLGDNPQLVVEVLEAVASLYSDVKSELEEGKDRERMLRRCKRCRKQGPPGL